MQTEFKDRMDEGLPGMPYDASGGLKNNLSYNAEETIPYGRAVVATSDEDNCALPSGSGDTLLGVSTLQHNNVNGQYLEKDIVGVQDKGRIRVEAEETIAVGDSVYMRYAGKKQVQTLVASIDFVASNVITGDVIRTDENGNSITSAISVNYNTNNQTTLEDLAAAIALATGVNSVTDDNSHTLTVTSDQDVEIELSGFSVAGGASQATFAVSESTAAIFNSQRGRFRNDADSSTAAQVTGVKWYKGGNASNPPVLELNKP